MKKTPNRIIKVLFASVCLTWTGFLLAQTDFFNSQKGAEIDFSAQIGVQKTLKLDDPFLVQLFARWKALGALETATNDLFELVFSARKESALVALEAEQDPKLMALRVPLEMYLAYELGHYQTFIRLWSSHASSTNFLKTELGLALDQHVARGFSRLILNTGLHITEDMKRELAQVEEAESKINYTLQALAALRSGKDAIKWIGKLESGDELRVFLAQSAVLAYAKEGQLGASGKLISQVIEPWMEEEEDVEKISLYYLSLARLLYQAGAFTQSEHFYDLIPEESVYFVKARIESLWSKLQRRDFPAAKGQLATLSLPIFESQFYPEIRLVEAIGNTMLCEFVAAQKSIENFISVNKKWAQRISAEVSADTPNIIHENEYVALLRRQLVSLRREREGLEKLGLERASHRLTQLESKTQGALAREGRIQWQNREQVLEAAIYKMKFVRVELLGRMRTFQEGLARTFINEDQVSVYQAASAKTNQIIFPSDGMVWSDELFKMSAQVKNLCLAGKL